MKYLTKGKKKMLDTDLYALTGEEFSLGRTNQEVVEEMVAAGIKIVQYREKEKKPLYKYKECLVLREITTKAGVTFIVNDDIDIALAIGADGIHVGQEDLPASEVRKLVGKDMIVGLSTHSPEQAKKALEEGVADYIGVGPIFSTSTKKDVCAPVGLDYLKFVVENIPLPFVAIGGIKMHNIDQVKKQGASLIAMVTEIVGAEDIQSQIANIREKLK